MVEGSYSHVNLTRLQYFTIGSVTVVTRGVKLYGHGNQSTGVKSFSYMKMDSVDVLAQYGSCVLC